MKKLQSIIISSHDNLKRMIGMGKTPDMTNRAKMSNFSHFDKTTKALAINNFYSSVSKLPSVLHQERNLLK